jgi:hypothetical protein
MPRLVRRAPLSERLKAYADPSDWLIWLSEELNSNDWEEAAQSYSLYIGFAANVLFIIAQANSGASTSYDTDDVFREVSGPGWIRWFMNLLALILGGAAFGNAWLVWSKRRHYRLFEQPVEVSPATPSAQRVRVDSSPAGATPLGYFKKVIARNSAAARAHPDANRDVWEVAVWDPNPLFLELFCLFSPLHVVLYYVNLPVAPMDPRPSVKVTTTIFVGALLSLHMWWLRSSFTQQIKDNAIINRQVLNEYDSKFVHPALQKQGRDVGIQTIALKRDHDSSVGVRGNSDDLRSEVRTYTPTTIISRTFRTNPNANYASQFDPDNLGLKADVQTPSLRPSYRTSNYSSTSTTTAADFSSPIRPSNTPNPFRNAPPISRTSTSDGGSLGVYSHAASPLRKSASANFLRDGDAGSRGTPRARDSLGAAGERRPVSPVKREGSPLKRSSMPSGERPMSQAERLAKGSGYGGLGVGRRESGRY